jgi:hypothetical protein
MDIAEIWSASEFRNSMMATVLIFEASYPETLWCAIEYETASMEEIIVAA